MLHPCSALSWVGSLASATANGQIAQGDAFAFAQDGFDLGNVHLGFRRQDGGNCIKGACPMLFQQISHPAFSGIVGGEGQSPVAETIVKLSQITGGGAGVFLGLIPLISRP